MDFDQLLETWNWKPIRNCPGRYILQTEENGLSLQDLLGNDIEVVEYQVDAAKDLVLVARLDKGGLISYKRKDGSLLHTLNTPAGFQRKLLQLGITKS